VSQSPVSPRAAIALVASVAAAVSLAGCGGSSKTSTSAAAPAAAGSSSKAASKPVSGNGGALKDSVNICELMPPSQISQITGKMFSKAQQDDTPSLKLFSCNYTTDPSVAGAATPEQLRLDIIGKDGGVALSADVDAAKQAGNKLTNLSAVSGIGDKAYGGGIEARLEVLYGDVLITISGLTEVSTDQGKQIISELHAKL
jgi:hypothetical protein